MESEASKSPTTYKRIQMWTDGETRQLLDFYANYMVDIGPMKKFKTKKEMWADIASRIPDKTPKQCEERYKTILKRKKVAVENNKSSGSKRKSIDFEEELNKISSMDDSIEPEVQISSQKFLKVEKKDIKKTEETKIKKKTIQETLIEIAEKKEEAKERRHQEKMALLQKVLEAKNK
ncbi:uncharacterized protein LOC124419486 [Lucilia cuprina]|uniref:uncharacterized protein LOC124419486 n=1 Tax=Lucilia cuprina TaxID=7375 RepID=UPI001F070A6A|nr:uncharacterized protein LOC124419486 [Lucilia cuprina]